MTDDIFIHYLSDGAISNEEIARLEAVPQPSISPLRKAYLLQLLKANSPQGKLIMRPPR